MNTYGDHLILRELADGVDAGVPVVLATVVATKRSVPRRAGTKMLVFGDGRLLGTIGGGEMEARVIEDAREAMRTGKTSLLAYTLLAPDRGDPGVCGGEVQIYLEPHMPPHTVLVIGAGHVGRAVVSLAKWLGYRTVVTDDRDEFIVDVPDADVRLAGSVGEALESHQMTADTSVVLVSRSVAIDVEAIPLLLDSPARYIGVLGSQRRWSTTRAALEDAGIEAADLQRIHAPIGIEIGAETVEEIAVSIMSDVIRVARTAAEEG
ncbi:MAG: XdhC family protein [Acidimicrobiia bacterium]|nr:XdhC family protein [Acidimicrobiia bacterium]